MILALIVVLLIPVAGLAEEGKIIEGAERIGDKLYPAGCWMWRDAETGGVMMDGPTCPEMIIMKDETIHRQLVCYDKMQEAMRAMDFVIRTVKFDSLLQEIAGRYIRENDTWLSTMRDCVKGE